MSETATSNLVLISFWLGLIPGAYLAYRMIKELLHHIRRDDEDLLE